MPYLPATASVSFLPDWPKPLVSENSATLVMPRFFMSSNTFSAAMRSVWGVLKTHFLTGSMITTAPAREMKGTPARSTSGTVDIVEPVVVPPTMRSTLSSSIRRLAKPLALLASLPSS